MYLPNILFFSPPEKSQVHIVLHAPLGVSVRTLGKGSEYRVPIAELQRHPLWSPFIYQEIGIIWWAEKYLCILYLRICKVVRKIVSLLGNVAWWTELYQIKTHYQWMGRQQGFMKWINFSNKAYFTLTHISPLYDNLLPKYIPLLVNGTINYQMF